MRPWHPLALTLQEIETALAHKLYYLAVATALTLPDICSALEQPTGGTSPTSYKKRYIDYLSTKYTNMTEMMFTAFVVG